MLHHYDAIVLGDSYELHGAHRAQPPYSAPSEEVGEGITEESGHIERQDGRTFQTGR
jgi:hypothetical protein